MINTVLGKVFGTRNDREIKRLQPRVAAINALEPEIKKLSDEQLRAKTDEFRNRIQDRLSRIPDELEADPERLKQLDKERLDATNEVLDEILEHAANENVHEAVIGMAHRGRLNVIPGLNMVIPRNLSSGADG